MSTAPASNRLPALAAEIRSAHADVLLRWLRSIVRLRRPRTRHADPRKFP